MTYWPWWLGAVGLAGTAIVYLALMRRALGFSGAVNTAVSSTAQRSERAAAELQAGDLDDELAAMTRAQFGDAAFSSPAMTTTTTTTTTTTLAPTTTAAVTPTTRPVTQLPATGASRSVSTGMVLGSFAVGLGLLAIVASRRTRRAD